MNTKPDDLDIGLTSDPNDRFVTILMNGMKYVMRFGTAQQLVSLGKATWFISPNDNKDLFNDK